MRSATSLLRVAGALLAVSLPGACVHVGHGPRIEPGAQYFINVSASRNADVLDQGEKVAPGVLVGGARGWVFDNGAAASLGLQLPPLALPLVLVTEEPIEQFGALLMADAYVQPRRAQPGGIDFGIGTLASTGIVMPYVQLGKATDGGLFTTQGLMIPYRSFARILYWMPSVSLRSSRPDGTRSVDYYVGAIVGREELEFPPRTRTQWALTIGVVAEMRRRRR